RNHLRPPRHRSDKGIPGLERPPHPPLQQRRARPLALRVSKRLLRAHCATSGDVVWHKFQVTLEYLPSLGWLLHLNVTLAEVAMGALERGIHLNGLFQMADGFGEIAGFLPGRGCVDVVGSVVRVQSERALV